ncbi:MAG: HAD hydrolase-like protein [Candidatus Binatia bacterium]|nr:HAD hydrolase-like protein [Candidatus Binatia bacterium]
MAGHARWNHVIFDLDGTLVDTVGDIAAALNYALGCFGFPQYTIKEVRQMVGEGARRLVEQALAGRGGDEPEVERVLAVFLAEYRAHPVDRSRAYPGVEELLRGLREAGVVATVLTNKPAGLSEEILSRLGLRPFIAALCGGDTLPQRKPDPSGVFFLCTTVGVPPPRTLLVGDAGIDRATAATAGVAFCGALWGYRSHEVASAELTVARSLEVLPLVLAS